MKHAVLMGDGQFNNQAHCGDGLSLIGVLRAGLLEGNAVSQTAMEGSYVQEIIYQLQIMSKDATHLFISAGANESQSAFYYFRGSFALEQIQKQPLPARPVTPGRRINAFNQIQSTLRTVNSMMGVMGKFQGEFQISYSRMLKAALDSGRRVTLCTIAEPQNGLDTPYKVLMSAFNDVIIQLAVQNGLPVLDIRAICNEKSDYISECSRELSEQGGQKMAVAINWILENHDFRDAKTVVYRHGLKQKA